LRETITIRAYHNHRDYSVGGSFAPEPTRPDVFDWERGILSRAPFPQQGRILVGAAGAGREVHWLRAQGYDAVGFEPSDLVDTANAHEGATASPIERGSYQDLVDAVEQRRGPLVSALSKEPFDGLLLGWGSVSHLSDPALLVALFKALRRHSPAAPVVASFLCSSGTSYRPDRIQRTLRRLYSALGAKGRPDDGLRYLAVHGFFRRITSEEIYALAAETGYDISVLSLQPYPHALFVPASAGSSAQDTDCACPRRQAPESPP
jgi:hypothetical protein